jgi:hypothetical protein
MKVAKTGAGAEFATVEAQPMQPCMAFRMPFNPSHGPNKLHLPSRWRRPSSEKFAFPSLRPFNQFSTDPERS